MKRITRILVGMMTKRRSYEYKGLHEDRIFYTKVAWNGKTVVLKSNVFLNVLITFKFILHSRRHSNLLCIIPYITQRLPRRVFVRNKLHRFIREPGAFKYFACSYRNRKKCVRFFSVNDFTYHKLANIATFFVIFLSVI